jgi:hypothetical protein
MKRWKIEHVDTAGFGAHKPPPPPHRETKNTAATATVTRDKQFVAFLFYKISEVNFFTREMTFLILYVSTDIVTSVIHVVPLDPLF